MKTTCLKTLAACKAIKFGTPSRWLVWRMLDEVGSKVPCVVAIILLTTLTAATKAIAAGVAPAWDGPRIEATASRWTWPSRLAFVNDAMRCTFAGTNENTQLQSIELRTSSGGWIPMTGRAGPLLERHPGASETFTRLPDGFRMERQLPADAITTAPGALLRTGARLQLAGNTPRLILEEDIRFLRTGRASVECFSIDLSPALPHTLIWRHGASMGTTNLTTNSVLRFPAMAFAIIGSNGVAVLRLTLPTVSPSPQLSEALIRQSPHGTRCSFAVTRSEAQPGETARIQLDLHLLPAATTLDIIQQNLAESQP